MRETEPSNDDGRLGRREFLGLGAAVAGTALAWRRGLLVRRACTRRRPRTAGTASAISSTWRRTSSTSRRSCSRPTHDRSARRSSSTVRELDANPVEYLHANEERLEQRVREAAGSYLRTSPDEIALTDSTTMGLALMYRGLRLDPATRSSRPSTISTPPTCRSGWRRGGPAPRSDVVRLYDDPATASRGRDRRSIARALTPRTRVRRRDVGPLLDGREAAAPRHRRRRARGEPAPARARARAALRRRRARLRRRGDVAGRARLRLVRGRLPQVALRPARDRAALGPVGAPGADSSRRSRASTAGHTRRG